MRDDTVVISEVPEIDIQGDEDGGIVLVNCGSRQGIWRSKTFRAFIDLAKVKLSAWDAQRDSVVPFKRGPR